jgi:hypothetical protein
MKSEIFDPREIVALVPEPTPLKNNCATPCPSPDSERIANLSLDK